MARINPDYWSFLVGQAILPERKTSGSRLRATGEPGSKN